MPLTLAITGATGLVGKRLAAHLRASGHTVYPLKRTAAAPGQATWDPATGQIQTPTKIDVLVHLAGRNVATRWSAAAKKEIADSRVLATQKLAQFLAQMPSSQRPALWLSASAIGIYGSRGDEILTEDSASAPRGKSFLADVCLDWEAATHPAEDAGIRVIHPRIGIVLSKDGGALAKMLTPAKLGLLGPVGNGRQWMAWISLTDLVAMLTALAQSTDIGGLINAVGPDPVRQLTFARTLAHVLHRPAIFPLPKFMVHLAFGQMGRETLLASIRAQAQRLPPGFAFQHTTLEDAIRSELKNA